MGKPLFRIYKDIVCVETESPHGRKWWDHGHGLAFMPIHIDQIHKAQFGRLKQSGRRVIAAKVGFDWVAVNTPRSDVAALQRRGLWPEGWEPPYTEVVYTPWPDTDI